jgi:two-component system, OmpR family, sensor histidine kinase MprB
VTLRWRITLILAAVAFGVGAAASTASYLSTSSQLRSSIDETLTNRASVIAADSQQSGRDGRGGRGDGGPADEVDCPVAGVFQPAAAAQLVSPDGTVTACIDGGPVLPYDTADLSPPSATPMLRTVTIDGQQYRLLTVAWSGGGILQIARSLAESDALLSRLRWQLAALVAAAVVIAAALGWVVASRLARPISRLRDATRRIATTLDLSTPVNAGGTGEVADLAKSFSTMIAEVARSQDQQRRLVSDASHEMRTPLTSLTSNLELLERLERLDPDERGEVIGDVLEDVGELTALLEELVELASDLAAAEETETVRLGDLARTVAARVHRRTHRDVVVVDHDPVVVEARPRQIERAVSNLIDNAVKYSGPAATVVEVDVEGARLTVRDRGRGIAPEDLGRVFDRFYRAVDVRTEPGSGLGLSIVDEIVRSHGGTVFARARAGGGAEVGFELPS